MRMLSGRIPTRSSRTTGFPARIAGWNFQLLKTVSNRRRTEPHDPIRRRGVLNNDNVQILAEEPKFDIQAWPCSLRLSSESRFKRKTRPRWAVNLVLVDATAKTKDGQDHVRSKKDDFEVLHEDGAAQKLEVFQPRRIASECGACFGSQRFDWSISRPAA